MIRQTRNGILVGVVVGLTLACGEDGSPTSPDRTSAPAAGATPPPTPTPPSPPAQSSPMSFKVDGTSTAAGSVTAGMAGGILSVGGTDASRIRTLRLCPDADGSWHGNLRVGAIERGERDDPDRQPGGWVAGGRWDWRRHHNHHHADIDKRVGHLFVHADGGAGHRRHGNESDLGRRVQRHADGGPGASTNAK